MKRYRYKVQITSRHSEVLMATSARNAKDKVWDSMKDGWTYGFKNKAAFLKGTKAERV